MIRSLAVALPFLAAGCAALGPSPAARSEAEKLSFAPQGEPASCVPIARIRETRVLDDSTIDFVLIDRTRLRNTLPIACPGLSVEDSISYSTSLSRLCSVDTVTVLHRAGGLQPGATCGLGEFQPVRAIAR